MANFFDQFDAPQTGNFFDQFDAPTSPRSGTAAMLTNMENLLPAAEQGANPDVSLYQKYLGPATIGETGEVFYKNEKGEPIPTEANKHVVLTDPRDNTMKVFERSEQTNEGPLVGISRVLAPGLATGPVSTATITKVPGMIGRGATISPTVTQLLGDIEAAKNAPEMAAQINRASTAKYADIVNDILDKKWLNPQNAPGTFGVVNRFSAQPSPRFVMQGLERAGPAMPEVAPLTMQDYNTARESLSKMAKGFDQNAVAAGIAKRTLNEWLPTAEGGPDLAAAQRRLQEGVQNYAIGKRLEDINTLAKEADLSPSEFAKAMQGRARAFLKSGDLRGLTPEEISQLKRIEKGTIPIRISSNLASMLGKNNWWGIVTGVATKGAAPIAGFGLQKLANALEAKQVAKLQEMIVSRSPMYQRLNAPVMEWTTRVEDATTAPTARNLSRLLIASRNLSNNLKDAGISVSPNDLLKSLYQQKPAGAEADDNE